MKAICRYMNRSEASVLVLIRDYSFPAKKIAGIWESDTDLADRWRVRQINGAKEKTLSTAKTRI